jgi:hypothetical protein
MAEKKRKGAQEQADRLASMRAAKKSNRLNAKCKTKGCGNSRPYNDRGGKRACIVESGFCKSCYHRDRELELYLHAATEHTPICDDVIRYVLLGLL